MSRARQIGGLWFDVRRKHEKATSSQLELLAAAEDIPIDDLLDEGLNQDATATRLRVALGEGVIPSEVLERRRAAKEAASRQPSCAICVPMGWECEGSITRHHFIPRWMMLMLENYTAYAARSRCTAPICIGRHRDLHLRGDVQTPKSIGQFLTDDQRAFAQKLLDEFREQHPAVFDLIMGGDSASYEHVLLMDYHRGAFRVSRAKQETASQSLAMG